MAKAPKKTRTKSELEAALKEQLQLLIHACESYDRGFEAIGKHIALSLRVLIHHHGNSRSLLEQLGLRSGRFYDSAGPINPRNLVAECRLVVMQLSPSGARYIPKLDGGEGLPPAKLIDFATWWNQPVLKDSQNRFFNRRELICHIADTDGGAHVDPELDEAYMDLSQNNSLGWVFTVNNESGPLDGRLELVCMRQIAYETLLTLRRTIPKVFSD